MKVASFAKSFAASVLVSMFALACSNEPIESSSSVKAVEGLGGEVEIQNWHTNACIDIERQDNNNGTPVHMWGCHNQWSQRWALHQITPGKYMIKNQGGRCLDVSNGDSGTHARIQIWDCAWGHPNQTFWIDRVQEHGGIVGYHLVNAGTNQPIAQDNARIGQQHGNREGTAILWKLNPK